MRALYILFCFVTGAICAYYGQDYIRDNADAINIVITVFTVFAGFLVAIISILGDPALLPDGSWRDAENHRDHIDRRLIRHTYLFWLYLVIIGLVFLSALLKKAPSTPRMDSVRYWVEYVYLMLGIAAFLLSLALPKMLMSIQRARIDAEIDNRKAQRPREDE